MVGCRLSAETVTYRVFARNVNLVRGQKTGDRKQKLFFHVIANVVKQSRNRNEVRTLGALRSVVGAKRLEEMLQWSAVGCRQKL